MIPVVAVEKWVEALEGKLNKAFLHFLPNFCHIGKLFKVEHNKGATKL